MFESVIILFHQDPYVCSTWSSRINFFYPVNFSAGCLKHAIPLGIEYTLHKIIKGKKELAYANEIPIALLFVENEIW